MHVTHLFFDMNSFFASVAQNEEPALIGRPVGVLTTDAPGATCIAASYEAKAHGVRMGTRQEEARRLCPGIVFRPAKHDLCVAYHHRIRAAVDRVIPIAEAHSVDEFSCKLMGREQQLETALAIAARLQRQILHDVGPAMGCSVGVAPGTLLAKIAAELQKPRGINWLHPDLLPGKIAHLALEDIPGVSKGMVARLARAGVIDVPALYALAPKQARSIWGSVVGEKVIRALHGEEVTWEKRSGQSIGHGQRLTRRNRTSEGARLVARRLVVKCAARLRREGKSAGLLHLSLRCERAGRQAVRRDLLPTQDTFALLAAFDAMWTELSPHAPVSVGIMLAGLVPAGAAMVDLFTPPDPQAAAREALCHALDGLNRRYGKDTVRIGALPLHVVPYTGAKIAFSRVPDVADFYE